MDHVGIPKKLKKGAPGAPEARFRRDFVGLVAQWGPSGVLWRLGGDFCKFFDRKQRPFGGHFRSFLACCSVVFF